MSLYVIGMPIGEPEEISLKAKELISQLDVLICESRKETSRLLRTFDIRPDSYEELSEHSEKDDLMHLVETCKTKKVGLVSDCGTPGFCDPGSDLIRLCREQGIKIRSLPGPSSLMTFLSLTGEQITEFYFKGFLSQKTEERRSQILKLKKHFQVPIVLMDTPYRLKKLLNELLEVWPDSEVVLGCQLGMESELVIKGSPREILSQLPFEKAEFVLLVRH